MPNQLRLVRLGGEAFSLDIPLHRTIGWWRFSGPQTKLVNGAALERERVFLLAICVVEVLTAANHVCLRPS